MRFLLFMPLLHFSAAKFSPEDKEYWEEIGERNLQKKLRRFKVLRKTEKRTKNIILFIGDGMGISAVAAARMLWAEQAGKMGEYEKNPFFMETFETSGIVRTSALNRHVTDSAAGAVALLSGRKVDQFSINLLPGKAPDCTDWNNSSHMIRESIPYRMVKNRRGGNVGIVTTTRITHGTPAAAYASGVTRGHETDDKNLPESCKGKDIASQLIAKPANRFKVLMGGGGGALHANRRDKRNIMEEWTNGKEYRRVVRNMDELVQLKVEKDTKVMGIFHEEHLDYRRERIKKGEQPSLANMTEKAIEVLQKNNRDGYFLLVEGGRIDTAEHKGQMRLASEELFDMDDAVKRARELTDPNETLILVTADHSQPILLPGYRLKNTSLYGGTSVFDPDYKAPGVVFVSGTRTASYSYTSEEAKDPEFVSPSLVEDVRGSHGAEDVPIYADGPYSWLFTGSMENTEVAYRMKYLLCLLSNHPCSKNRKKKN